MAGQGASIRTKKFGTKNDGSRLRYIQDPIPSRHLELGVHGGKGSSRLMTWNWAMSLVDGG